MDFATSQEAGTPDQKKKNITVICNLPQYICVHTYVLVYAFIESTSNMFVNIQSHFST